MYGAVFSGLKRISRGPVLALCLFLVTGSSEAADTFLVLCYHDVPRKASTPEDVPRHIFVQQLEYLKTHGYTVVSPDDIAAAQSGARMLPAKAVLLTFDDAYRSFYDFVYPVLRLYGYPAVLSIVTSWIGQRPDYIGDKELMSWDQIREVVHSRLVYGASHSHDLHRGVVANPAGNEEASSSSFMYEAHRNRYEGEESFRLRIAADLKKSRDVLQTHTGVKPHIVTWPYGQFNRPAVEEARRLGFNMMLTLMPGAASLSQTDSIRRNIITGQMECEEFVSRMKNKFNYQEKRKMRAVQIDLDTIVDPSSYEQSDANLGLLIERLVAQGVNTVFLQGFCDRDGSGNIGSLYFYSETFPVVLDFLSHAANRIRVRGIEVYIWMPVLSYELADRSLNEALKVRVLTGGESAVTTSWYRRLSPFDERSLAVARGLYRDLAKHVRFDGILFQDDAYLSDHEDYHPAALDHLRSIYGAAFDQRRLAEDRFKGEWTRIKTARINQFIEGLMTEVRYFRPEAKFARNIYSEVVLNSSAQEWFSQSFEDYVRSYDYTVVMAYPQMEHITGMKNIKKWFAALVDKADEHHALKKVVFKIQSFDWSKEVWIPEGVMAEELRSLLSRGVQHIAYYPDNVFEDRPRIEEMVSIISSRELPGSWNDESFVEGN